MTISDLKYEIEGLPDDMDVCMDDGKLILDVSSAQVVETSEAGKPLTKPYLLLTF